MSWTRTGDGRWLHRPWWKVAINAVLRALQRSAPRKWVIFTRATGGEGENPPEVVGYGFGRILHDSA